MNRFGSSGGLRGNANNSRFYNSTYPRYSQANGSDSEETSSTHSVRVSRLIEKIKSQQQRGGGGGVRGYGAREGGFNYIGDELIYSRVERGGGADIGTKRTVRERVTTRNNDNDYTKYRSNRDTTPLHKTTVLLNNDMDDNDNSGSGGDYYGNRQALYSSRYTSGIRDTRNTDSGPRYFGQETDYEYDRILSRRERESQVQREEERKFGTLTRGMGSGGGLSGMNSGGGGGLASTRNSVPKIILHEEAVAEIPTGRIGGTRSPSVNRDVVTTDDEFNEKNKGSRFLGGLLTLKRGRKGGNSNGTGTLRSHQTHSPTSTATRRTASYLNVPGNSRNSSGDNANDSSSSPKYYVPYHRSTPTLYESTPKFERDRMSSAGGSVLSNGSYVNKHVSRSMSMKHRFAPVHRENVLDYYNDNTYKKPPPPENNPSKLKRSKSMPGKKLTSLIGSWVSNKGSTLKRQNTQVDKQPQHEDHSDHERLISKNGKKSEGGKWGTLLRFGKKKPQQQQNGKEGVNVRGVSPERPVRNKRSSAARDEANRMDYSSRSSISPIRVGARDDGNARYGGPGNTGTLLRGNKRVSGGGGFY